MFFDNEECLVYLLEILINAVWGFVILILAQALPYEVIVTPSNIYARKDVPQSHGRQITSFFV